VDHHGVGAAHLLGTVADVHVGTEQP